MSFLFRLNKNKFVLFFYPMRILKILFLGHILFSTALFGQIIEPASGVSKNVLQIELESLYTVAENGIEKNKSWSTPNALLRFGLLSRIELQLNVPFIKEKMLIDNKLTHSFHKFGDAQVGLSFNLWSDKKTITDASIMARAIIPVANGISIDNPGSLISLNLSKSFLEKFTFSMNIGTVTEPHIETSGFYIANLDYTLSTRVHFFIENHSDFNSHNGPSQTIATGFGFVISNYCNVDFSVASGLNHDIFYTGGILTWIIGS